MRQIAFSSFARLFLLLSVLTLGVQASGSVFTFTGTLQNPVYGDATVAGQFDLDTSTGTISSFHFLTPVETIDSAGLNPSWTGNTFIVNATNPNSTFVNLVFVPGGLNPPDAMQLIFQTSLAGFDPSTFYTGLIDYPGGATQSNLTCINGCNGYGSLFVASTPVPEPTSMILISTGVGPMVAKRRKASLR